MKLIRHFKRFSESGKLGDRFFRYNPNLSNTKTVFFKFPTKYNLQTSTINYELEFSDNYEAPVDFEDSFLFQNEYSNEGACLNWHTESWFLRNNSQAFVFISVPIWVKIEFGDSEVCFFRLNVEDICENQHENNDFSYRFVYKFAFNKDNTRLSRFIQSDVSQVELVVEYNNTLARVEINEQMSGIKLSDVEGYA